MKIIKEGKLTYDFTNNTIIVDGFHLDAEGGGINPEQILVCMINALRRELYKHKKKKIEMKFDNPIKPEAANVKPVGWWAND